MDEKKQIEENARKRGGRITKTGEETDRRAAPTKTKARRNKHSPKST